MKEQHKVQSIEEEPQTIEAPDGESLLNPVQLKKKRLNSEYYDDYTTAEHKPKFIRSSSEVKRTEAADRRREVIKS